MSESVTVNKDFDIQVDYVKCTACGHDSAFSVESDSHGDLQIFIEPHDCDE